MADPELTSEWSDEAPSVPRWRADGLMFWGLTAMGFAMFAPCVLVPEWKSYERAAFTEQLQQHKVGQLKAEVDRESRLLEAIRSDPAVVTRLAQRDLGLYRRDERAVLVGVPPVLRQEEVRFVPTPVQPPEFVQPILRKLPDYDYAGLFCDPPTRLMLMALSSGLMVVAFVLFGRKKI